MVAPTTVSLSSFTVVGLHYQGTNAAGEIASLWSELETVEADLETISAEAATYGVSFGGDPETGVFEYVAGVKADPDAEVPEPLTAVELPGATYIHFETTLATIESTMAEVHHEWLPTVDYELAMGPEFERYPAEFDRSDLDAPFEVFVPVEATAD